MTIEELVIRFPTDRLYVDKVVGYHTDRADHGNPKLWVQSPAYTVWRDAEDGPRPTVRLTVKDDQIVGVHPTGDSWYDMAVVLVALDATIDGRGNVILPAKEENP